jgi:hypothetical protein
MTDNVFILGAGASFEAGAPMMGNFLDRAEDMLRNGEVNDFADDFQKVFSLIMNLQAIYAKSDLDLSNIEAIFGVLEMASTIRRLPEIPAEEIGSYRDALITVIVKTLERSIIYRVNGLVAEKPEPVGSYQKLSQIIKGLSENRHEKSSIITFNYDVALDHALFHEGFNVQYCTHDEVDTNAANKKYSIRLLKLHGSSNWGNCTKCHNIVPYDMPAFFSTHNKYYGEDGSSGKFLEVSDYLPELKHCGERLEAVPVIVPPTWNKSSYHGALSNVWSAAAQELSEARNIYVFGYSLPESDPFFRYLFALGTLEPSRIRRFWVFDPDNSVEKRYLSFIGRGIRNRFQYHDKNFYNDVRYPGNEGALKWLQGFG